MKHLVKQCLRAFSVLPNQSLEKKACGKPQFRFIARRDTTR